MNTIQLKLEALQTAIKKADKLIDKVMLGNILLELKKEQLYGQKKSGN